MNDVFHEVDEALRRQRLTFLWQRYKWVIITLIITFVTLVGFYLFRSHQLAYKASQSAIGFEEALKLLRSDKDKAISFLTNLSLDTLEVHNTLIRIKLAKIESLNRNTSPLDNIANDINLEKSLRHIAYIYKATNNLDALLLNDVQHTMNSLISESTPWHFTAKELLGLALIKSGDLESAGRIFNQIVIDITTPKFLRGRVEVYLALIDAGQLSKVAPTN